MQQTLNLCECGFESHRVYMILDINEVSRLAADAFRSIGKESQVTVSFLNEDPETKMVYVDVIIYDDEGWHDGRYGVAFSENNTIRFVNLILDQLINQIKAA